jgi:pheromone shutdown-related protein TraB
MQYKNLKLIGTSHIAKQSLEEVASTIQKEKPDIIALELDKRRFYALTHDVKRKTKLTDIKKIGIKGFLFNIFGAWIENKLGKMVGVKPGSEMMTAIVLAKKYKIKIALIDQDIQITLRRISAALTKRERWNFIKDLVKGLVFKKSEMKKLGIKKLDLTKVPPKTLIKKLTKIMEKRYPGLYKVLVEERNNVMAYNLNQLMLKHPDKKIIAIIGAGHEDELLALIKSQPQITYSFKIRNVYK